ncbi:putative sodium-coupled neutral amino acid transporter 7 [Apis dorsata]|uniref:putative sodium-coupled neutral amino acid transporter 7 n=1 Tax=Apis dorsata TaxID=7462 RepID=UPI0003DF7AC2|nr:putative sodium-coupled neutral amino acid transporter 7 [Apis dorsata]
MNCLIGDMEQLISNDMLLCTAPSPSSIYNNRNNNRSGTNVISTIFLIVNATLGAGLLNFPQAFDKAGGLVTSISIQLILLVFITAALIILANCSDITNTCCMQDMFANFYGQKSFFLCAFCIIIYSFGYCLTFLIVIGDQFDRILSTYYGFDYCHTWYLSRTFVTIITCSLFILPLCFFKRLDVLSYTSSIGCITILYVVLLIVYKSFTYTESPNPMKIWPDNKLEALQIIPIICFAYQNHMTAIPMYACMKERNLCKFTLCATVSMIICFTIYTVVGISGYATFGIDKVPSDILQGYTDKSIILTLGIIFIAIKNFTTYPIVLYCGRDALLSLLGMNINITIKFRVFITLIWYILSLIIAILVLDISPVINLLGVLSAVFIFIFPGICLFQCILLKDSELHLNKDRLLIFFAVFIIALGAFLFGIIFVETIEDLSITSKTIPLVTGFRHLKKNLCT